MIGAAEHAIPAEAEEFWTEDGDEHVGWFCVRTDPFPCPAPDCGYVAEFMTAAHLVLVWEERDDPNLLRHAQRSELCLDLVRRLEDGRCDLDQ